MDARKAEYNPDVFAVANIEQAKRIILTPEPGRGPEERWAAETPYLAGLIEEQLSPSADSVILDFGCGVGRLAKELIARTGCRVIGVDISESMRALAASYVGSGRFMACAPEMLIWLRDAGIRFDGALAVWVLQHCLSPSLDIGLLRGCLAPHGKLFVVNENARCVPALLEGKHAWVNDDVDVRATIRGAMNETASGILDPNIVPLEQSQRTFWGVFGLGAAKQ